MTAKVRPRRRRAEPAIPHPVNAIGGPPGNEPNIYWGFEIDGQLELRWLLYWKIGGLGPFRILST